MNPFGSSAGRFAAIAVLCLSAQVREADAQAVSVKLPEFAHVYACSDDGKVAVGTATFDGYFRASSLRHWRDDGTPSGKLTRFPLGIVPEAEYLEIDYEINLPGAAPHLVWVITTNAGEFGENRTYLWNVDQGTVTRIGNDFWLRCCSSDGKYAYGGEGFRPYRVQWNGSGYDNVPLGTTQLTSSRAAARVTTCSRDGKTAYGFGNNATGTGTSFIFAHSVEADGTAIRMRETGNTFSVYYCEASGDGQTAFAETSRDTMLVVKPNLDYVELQGTGGVRAVSDDGSVGVGGDGADIGVVPCVLIGGVSAVLPPIDDPDLGRIENGYCSSVTADGSTAFGSMSDQRFGLPKVPFMWDAVHGSRRLADVFGREGLREFRACSRDGRVVFVETDSRPSGVLRFTRVPNSAPVVVAPSPKTVECVDGEHVVKLQAKVSDPDGHALRVVWRVDGVARQNDAEVASGSTLQFSFSYEHGEHEVTLHVSDGFDTTVAGTTVTVEDTTAPIVVAAEDVKVPVDPRQLYATVRLKRPSVTDSCDESPRVVSDAPAKFPLGLTRVRWTVTDAEGNVAMATQKVTVVNAAPIAKAGPDATKRTTAKRVRVALDGSKSRDPDRHDLKYRWVAAGARLSDPTRETASGMFPVGTTKVRLTVVDEAGAKSTDTMTVRVQAVRTARAAAVLADAALRDAEAQALVAAQRDLSAVTGAELIGAAAAVGKLAGDDLQASETASLEELANYLVLRRRQSELSREAGRRFVEAYLTSGDENLFSASMNAYVAGAFAAADLASEETTEVADVSTSP
jgi:uncharacterized membrane protein